MLGAREQLYPSSDISSDAKLCRICLDSDELADDEMIAPCRCAGSMGWVHRKCLDEWRAQEQVPFAFTHCPQCKFQYRTEVNDAAFATKRLWLTLFVARDTIGVFVVLQGVAAGLALLMHACDPHGYIKRLYPPKWAEVTAASRLSIGPYYVSTVILLLAALGLLGLVLTTGAAHGAPPHRAPSTRCTADLVHHVGRRCSPSLARCPARAATRGRRRRAAAARGARGIAAATTAATHATPTRA